MSERRMTVDSAGLRLDQFLVGKLSGCSRGHAKDLILRGSVTVNGAPRPPDFRLLGGEVIRVRVPESRWAEVPFETWVIHEDADILVLNKPSGLLMHPMGGSWQAHPQAALENAEANLAGLLLRHRPDAAASGVSRCGLVHRLDRQTSGVLLVAKRPQAQAKLLDAFRDREVHKVYRAIVWGEAERTTVDAPIGRRPGSRKVQVTPWGRSASTEFETLGSAAGLSLVQAEPKTGRTHQIRAHLALLKHPVIGDLEWFGPAQRAALGARGLDEPPRMMLHAYRLRFAHPKNGRAMSLSAPLPADFRAYWASVLRQNETRRQK